MKRTLQAAGSIAASVIAARSVRSVRLLPLCLLVFVHACGGGGGGGAPQPPNSAPNPPSSPNPPPSVTAPSGLSYATPQVYFVASAITPLAPSVTGTVASYTVNPSLPAGLTLDAASGVITGTPTEPTPPRDYTITAGNDGGSTSFVLSLGTALERATADRDDENEGPQVHAIYVLPADGVDEEYDRYGRLEGSVRSWSNWFAGQTGGSHIRLDTYDGGRLDVTFLRLRRSDADMNAPGLNVRDRLEGALLAHGFDVAEKIYLVYYGGNGAFCGKGAWPPTQHGNVGALYIKSSGCPAVRFASETDAPGYWEALGVHEVLHVLGHAASCAPNHSDNGHVQDSPEDVLFAGGATWVPALLDANHDDYYAAAVTDCLDLSSSAFLEPAPADAVLPPGWPYYNLADAGCATEATVTPDPLGAASQVMLVNAYEPQGTPGSIDISELVLDLESGLYQREHRETVPFLGSAVVPSQEHAVFAVSETGSGSCIAVIAAEDRPGRFVVRAP